jgi:hypothetical protein
VHQESGSGGRSRFEGALSELEDWRLVRC